MKSNILRLTILCATLSLPLFTTTSCKIEDKINANTDSILALIDSVTELKNQLDTLKEEHDNKIKELSDKHISEVNELTSLINQNKDTLDSLKEDYDKKISELEQQSSSINSSLNELKEEYKTKVSEIENTIASLNSAITTLDNKYKEEVQRIENDYNTKINSLKSDYDSKLSEVNEALASLTEKDKEIIDRITTLESEVASLLEVKTYTVSFEPNNGESSFTQIVNEYSLVSKPTNPTKLGYTFVSWIDEYNDPWFFGQSLVTKDITLRAKYVVNTYKINLDANGGSCLYSSLDVTYNESYSLPIASKEGFTFKCWTYNDEDVLDTSCYLYTNDVTYVAGYSRSFTVSFDTNGGNELDSITYNDWILTNLPTPIKGEYRFGGWYIGTTKVENGYKNVEQVDLTLKASWINAASLFEYQEIDGEITILNYIGSYTDVEIPSKIEGKNVTSISVDAFKNNMNLTSVKFNRNLTSIPTGLLEGQEHIVTLGIYIDIPTTLKKLFNVTNSNNLPTSLENIEYSYINYDSNNWRSFFIGVTRAYNFSIPSNGSEYLPSFTDCINIKTLNYPETYLYCCDFYNCTNLISINIPRGVTKVGDSAFYNCSSLTSVNLPNSVTYIGDSAFYDCHSLTSINIPDGVTYIGDSAFYNCSLTSVKLPDGIKFISNSLFEGCIYLTSVNIPDGVTYIGTNAFQGCPLTSVNLPDGVTTISEQAFYCDSLTSINIPNSVTYIGDYALGYCDDLVITYNRTVDEWNELVSEVYIGSYKSVICTDGTI
ncbi:MAG: leucine-rich repeat protein [Acholeplasmatales bacterium]|nr:leucine-rich repeat protein [Acholeplasmatales bacterium]